MTRSGIFRKPASGRSHHWSISYACCSHANAGNHVHVFSFCCHFPLIKREKDCTSKDDTTEMYSADRSFGGWFFFFSMIISKEMDRQDETRRLADKQTDRCRDISVLSRWKYLLCYVGAIHMLRQETEAYIMCWTLMCRNLIRWVSKDAKCSRYTVNISSVRFSRGYKVKIHLRKWFGKIWLNNDHLELLDKELNNKNPTIWQMWWKPLQEYVRHTN